MGIFSIVSLIIAFLSVVSQFSSAADTITPSSSINDTQTLVSKDATFEIGFFSPGSSKNRYLGMWYKNIPDRRIVWVANRVAPINDSSGVLILNRSSGNLEILSHNRSLLVWSSNSTRKLQNPIAQLLESGNLVLRDETDGEDNPDLYAAWQSFDYPSDTLLSGMKLGWDAKSGLNRRVTAWKSPDDPSPGEITLATELSAFPQTGLWKGSQKLSRSGPWIGTRFSDVYEVKPENPIFNYTFIHTDDEIYYVSYLRNKSVIVMPVANETTSTLDSYVWAPGYVSWQAYAKAPKDTCSYFSHCGNYGICSIDDFPLCKCIDGFTPKWPSQWGFTDYSDGCVRIQALNCSRDDEFAMLRELKLPDTANTWVNESMSLEECRVHCLSNCSCVAYTNSDIRNGGSGCAIWFNDLFDIKQLQVGGQDLYVRMPFSHSGKPAVKRGSKMKILAAIIAAIVFAVLVALMAGCCIYKRRRTKLGADQAGLDKSEEHQIKEDDIELPVFELAVIAEATNNFSMENKLGEGGFGSVYKGILEDGQKIAVKRLSISSGQGQDEFKNEALLIAKLQHRNLVKLVGCCIDGIEKMLIYEFMPHGSLDRFIFVETRSVVLGWPKRFTIMCGIARGLLYLHQDSVLRIIHRDLKASNVLLDNELNPKISDFGMAKICGGDQTEGNTSRIAGTYGYMAPEYAITGHFSVKSDVYSFGVLLLEIISGKRNRGLVVYDNRSLHLVELAWLLWTESRPSELIDESIAETCSLPEVLRCIQVGLLCVQQHPRDRPSMTSVVLMLGSEIELPLPKEPAIFGAPSTEDEKTTSVNQITITSLEAR